MDNQEPAAARRTTASREDQERRAEGAHGHDIFTDPALAADSSVVGTVRDPVQEFLQTWWKQMLYLILGVLAITYFISSFREAREDALLASADYFYAVDRKFEAYQSAFRDYQAALREGTNTDADQAVKEDKDKAAQGDGLDSESDAEGREKRLTDLKIKVDAARQEYSRMLADAVNQSSEPYKELRALYAIKEARLEESASDLAAKASETEGWKSVADAGSFDRLQAELAALAVARGLIDSQEGAETGKRMLKELAQGAHFAAVSAAVAFSEVAEDAAEKKAALDVLIALQSRHPEQNDLLREHLTRLKAEAGS